MITVDQLLRGRAENNLWTIEPAVAVRQALELMAEKDVGALPVVEGSALVGIFSERDFARTASRTGKDYLVMQVRELMTADVLTIKPEYNLDDCMALMTRERIRHLPVMDDGRLIGMVTIGDVVKAIIDSQRHTIDYLEDYILGEGYGR